MNAQAKNIKKTIATIIVIMVTILVLFFNKITTPRYLSNIELKINGLELVNKADQISIGKNLSGDFWLLLARDEEDKLILDELHRSLKTKIREQVVVVYRSTLNSTIDLSVNTTKKTVPIIKPSGEFLGYFKSPYDKNKMILTLSSVITHR